MGRIKWTVLMQDLATTFIYYCNIAVRYRVTHQNGKKTLIELVPTVLAAGRLSVRSYLLPRMGDNIPNLSQREVFII